MLKKIFLIFLFSPAIFASQVLESYSQHFLELYKESLAEKSLTLSIEAFNSPKSNMEISWNKESALLRISKKLIANKNFDQELFSALACHEMGHIFGGAPLAGPNRLLVQRGTVEGQADYYATLKCLRRVFRSFPNMPSQFKATLAEQAEARQKCSNNYDRPEDIHICQRSITASLRVIRIMEEDFSNSAPASFFQRHPVKVLETLMLHSSSYQCRLDTAIAGALCNTTDRDDLSDESLEPGTCMEGLGSRPRCWFNGLITAKQEAMYR